LYKYSNQGNKQKISSSEILGLKPPRIVVGKSKLFVKRVTARQLDTMGSAA